MAWYSSYKTSDFPLKCSGIYCRYLGMYEILETAPRSTCVNICYGSFTLFIACGGRKCTAYY